MALTDEQIRQATLDWVMTLAGEVRRLVDAGMGEEEAIRLVQRQGSLALATARMSDVPVEAV
jgi:hypothetical protein